MGKRNINKSKKAIKNVFKKKKINYELYFTLAVIVIAVLAVALLFALYMLGDCVTANKLLETGDQAGQASGTESADQIGVGTQQPQSPEPEPEEELGPEVLAALAAEKLAKCLTGNGSVLYGAYWSENTKNQENVFGEAFQYIEYVECTEDREACQDAGVTGYPTWVIKNHRYPGEKPLETLSELSGCGYP